MALASGFDRPVHDAQGCFRAVMRAMARPGLVTPLATSLAPPAPLTPDLAAIALTLADAEAPLWLDAALAASDDVRAFLRFHTGARIVDGPREAALALVADAARPPDLDAFAQGTDAYPDRSTTVVVAVDALVEGEGLRLQGPGVNGVARLSIVPALPGLTERLRANAASFPRGIDLVFAAPGRVAALPRSSRLAEAA